MAYLPTNPDNETDAGTLELDGVGSIVSADVGGFTYVFVAGGLDDGISVFRLNANGTLTPIFDLTDNATLKLDGARGLSTAMVDGNTYLFAVGEFDDGVSVFRVNTNGTLTGVTNVADDATLKLDQAWDTATARVGTSSYLFVAGQADDGISTFRIAGDGRLTGIDNLADGGSFELDGVRALAACVVGGTTFLIAGGGVDDGISVFSVSAAGALGNTSNLTDAGALELDGVSDIATAVIGGITYVFVASADDSGVSAFSLNAAGTLTSIDNESDTAATLIAGANSLSVATIGSSSYLTVGGTESGLSLYRIENGAGGTIAGSLTFAQNIDDVVAAHELSGTVTTHAATVGGTTYLIDGGAADDGVSVFGSRATSRLFFTTQEPGTDARIAYVGSDGYGQTVLVDSVPTPDLVSFYPQEVGIDTAAGLYFAVSNAGITGTNAYLLRGSLNSGAAPTVVVDFPNSIIVNTIQLDAINHKIYACYQDDTGTNGSITGIRVYSYDPLTGAVTDNGFLTTAVSDNRANESGYFVLDPRDFALDATIGRLFYTEKLDGLVEGIYRLDLASPNVATQLVSQAQFPDSGSAGYFYDVEVDTVTDLVYFTTQSQYPFPDAGYSASESALWYISENATSGTATQVTLTGLPAGHHFYPGDMSFDQSTRQLYIESGESFEGVAASNNVIYVFQLNLAGTSASLVNTISLDPQFYQDYGQFGGLTFAQLASLGPLSGTATAILEQGAAVTLLLGAPTIIDDGNNLASLTVRITGGTFDSSESSFTDDDLGFGGAMLQSGMVPGTNITIGWSQATGTLSFTGYDTLAHYQTAIAGMVFRSSGDNPTNYGLNTNRTITWTISDGPLNFADGSQSSGTTTITIAAINDAPVNVAPGAISGDEDSPAIAISGLRVTDPDANPALTDITLTLSVEHGVLTLGTAVPLGIATGDITGDGTDLVTVTATLNEINATLSAVGGLVYTPSANFNGSDTLHVVSNDGGSTGTGGALADTDDYAITVTAVPEPPLVGTPDPDILDASQGGFDSVSGLAGDDVIYYGAALTAASDNDGGPGALDELALQGNYALTLGVLNLVNIERLALLSGSVTTYGDLAGASYDYDIATVDANVAPGQQLVVDGRTLKAGESLVFDGSAETDGGRFLVYGGLAADTLEGGTGADTLDGKGGADTLVGGGGNDWYYVDNALDVVVEGVAEGAADRIFASISYTLGAGVYVEQLTTNSNGATTAINLTGNELANGIYGNAGANVLDGRGGADTLVGLGGNDWYYVDSAADVVVEGAAEGAADRVLASVSYTLGAGAYVEQLTTTNDVGTATIYLTGNAFAQTITGNAGNNLLDGGGGVDTLAGLGGNDWYYVDNAADVVIEGAAGGAADRVLASVNYALGAGVYVEQLTTSSNAGTTAINLTGNAFAQTITGNAGANVLDGGASADTLVGLGGNDWYYVDNALDVVIEGAAEGTADRIFASLSYTLGAGVYVEQLTTNSNGATIAINLTGNELANTISGNAGANVLDGKGGADTLNGLAGLDTFAFTTALGGGNVDTINGFVVADDTIQLENAVFTGLAAGALAAGAFNTGAAATQADDRILYNSATGALLFDADGLGGVAAVQFATVSAGLPMTASDFVVI